MAELTHLDERGHARMVDVGDKEVTRREARAQSFVRMNAETIARLRTGETPKGDVFASARIAGIAAAKKTSELIPLCHLLPLQSVKVELELREAGVHIETRVRCEGRTGVEMEALVAASVAALTLYDMLKAVERGIVIEDVRLLEKSGGASGHFIAPG